MLLVNIPVVAIFSVAEAIVAQGTVNKKDGKVDGVKVGEHRSRACRQAPGEAHQPVSCVVDFTGQAPPAADEKLCATLRIECFQMLAPWSGWIASESIFFTIGPSKDGIPVATKTKVIPSHTNVSLVRNSQL